MYKAPFAGFTEQEAVTNVYKELAAKYKTDVPTIRGVIASFYKCLRVVMNATDPLDSTTHAYVMNVNFGTWTIHKSVMTNAIKRINKEIQDGNTSFTDPYMAGEDTGDQGDS